MASVSDATQSTLNLMFGAYLLLWNFLTVCFTNTYAMVRFAGGLYPPAKRFMISCENAFDKLKDDSAHIRADKHSFLAILQEFWNPASTLEALGLLSVAIPVLVGMLGSTACVMLVGLVVTVGFFICGMLALPVALLCAIGYSVGTAAGRLYDKAGGVLSSLLSWVRSTIRSVFESSTSESSPLGNIVIGFEGTAPRKHLEGSANGGKGSTDTNSSETSADGSPKISSTVQRDNKSTNVAT